jgi:hypothetical protein
MTRTHVCSVPCDEIDAELLQLIEDMGCLCLALAAESGPAQEFRTVGAVTTDASRRI